MARADWDNEELEHILAAYLEMLTDELLDRPYNKSAVRRKLLPKLKGRSEASIEFKNRNISAALNSIGMPNIIGYLPAWNYQKEKLDSALAAAVVERPSLTQLIQTTVQRQAETRPPLDLLSIYDNIPPKLDHGSSYLAETVSPSFGATHYDFLELEALNRSIGLAGEELVVDFERSRLESMGKADLANRIEHVSVEDGDGAGFDIRSFDITGTDLFIEVKTTRFNRETPFFISSNEVRFSSAHRGRYSLYRLYQFEKNPRLFELRGSVEENCHLAPTVFRAGFS